MTHTALHTETQNATLPAGLLEWLASGERGMSSNTMVTHLAGISAGAASSHPYDPADLRRCMLLLDRVPELKWRMQRMRTVSKEWNALMDVWDDITTSFLTEAPDNWRDPRAHWRAPRTYKLMQ